MNKSKERLISDAIETHNKLISGLQADGIETIVAAAAAVTKTLKDNGTVYLCGNGGSAADAQHIAGELVGRFRRERSGLGAVALSTDSSVITAIANDYGYDKVFARQVEALVKKGDILWAFSTSGTSESIIAAVQSAKEKGASVLAFTGRDNSKLQQMADICFCVRHESTARSQEVQQLAYHIICDLVEESFCE